MRSSVGRPSMAAAAAAADRRRGDVVVSSWEGERGGAVGKRCGTGRATQLRHAITSPRRCGSCYRAMGVDDGDDDGGGNDDHDGGDDDDCGDNSADHDGCEDDDSGYGDFDAGDDVNADNDGGNDDDDDDSDGGDVDDVSASDDDDSKSYLVVPPLSAICLFSFPLQLAAEQLLHARLSTEETSFDGRLWFHPLFRMAKRGVRCVAMALGVEEIPTVENSSCFGHIYFYFAFLTILAGKVREARWSSFLDAPLLKTGSPFAHLPLDRRSRRWMHSVRLPSAMWRLRLALTDLRRPFITAWRGVLPDVLAEVEAQAKQLMDRGGGAASNGNNNNNDGNNNNNNDRNNNKQQQWQQQ